jgi:hypothetical protein
MAATRTLKTSFTAGEVSAELLGRPDLRAYANGASRLRNVFIQPTGGVQRRPGLRHISMLPGPVRLIAFEFNTEQTYLLAFQDGAMRVYVGDAEVAVVPGPWTAAMLNQLAWTQSADTLLLVHPEMVPQRITRTSHTTWSVQPWAFTAEPFHRYAHPSISLQPGATMGDINLIANGPVFQPAHVGSRLRLRGRRLMVLGFVHSAHVVARIEDSPLPDTNWSTDWEEAAFSAVRGWPATLCFHQDRLAIGGSRDLPNRLWLSQTGDLFNFDTGTGLDDQAIEFGLVSDQVNAIRGLFSGQHLQIFTSGAEWMVTGSPLTPANIQINRQTRVGSSVTRTVPPVDVDGATIFAARSGRGIYEFVYTDLQQVYQANDLALVAKHLVRDPVALAYDQVRRLLHVAMADGTLATLTLYRAEQVTAWTRQETDGAFRSLAEIEGTVWAAVERAGSWRIERFDETLALDAALTGASGTGPQDTWRGLEHLEDRSIGILADGAPRADGVVRVGTLVLDPPATSLEAGLRFTHVIEPLPPDLTSAVGVRAAPVRLVSVTFRLLETAALAVDIGTGVRPVPFRRLDTPLLDGAPPRFTGDIRLRALGWRRDAMAPLWRIEDDTPLPLTLLAVTTEMRSTD